MELPVLALLLLASGAARAGFESGEMMLHLCQSNASICLAYLEGVVDGAEALAWHGVVTGVCVPERVESAEVRQIFLEYAERQSEILKLPAGMLVIDALREAWRCPPQR